MTNQEIYNLKNEIKLELKDIENVTFSKISNIKHVLSNNTFFVINWHYNSRLWNEIKYAILNPNRLYMLCLILNKQCYVEKTVKVSV